MELLYLKIIMILSALFSSGHDYEKVTIEDNIITIEYEDGTIEKHRIDLISPEPATIEVEQ